MPITNIRLFKHLPLASIRKVRRRLLAQADAARDAGRREAAAALYEEVLDLGWPDAGLRVQCANMLKDSGQYSEAKKHYLRAIRERPTDADVPMQLGHCLKLAGDLVGAQEQYCAALKLRPSWTEARKELASLGLVPEEGDEPRSFPEAIIGDLLPRHKRRDLELDRIKVLRLGRHPQGEVRRFKVLRGIEAIRGHLTTAVRMRDVRLLLDGRCVAQTPLVIYPHEEDGTAIYKHVFNIWHDFTHVDHGVHTVEIEVREGDARVAHHYSERLEVVAPLEAKDAAASDSWVPHLAGNRVPLEDAINALPSVRRDVQRRLLPADVRTILVQRVDQLGDLVCSVPALKRLRALFPEARLIGLVNVANAAFAGSLGLFDDLVTVQFPEDLVEGRRLLAAGAQEALRSELRRYSFDLAIDLGEGDDSRPLLLLSGAPFLYGFRHRQFTYLHAGLDFGTHDPMNGNDIIPVSRKLLLLIEGLAVLALGSPEPDLGQNIRDVARFGINTDDSYVFIHTGARLYYSRWPWYSELIALILERTTLRIVVVTDDMDLGDRIPRPDHGDRVHIMVGLLPFEDLDALIANAAVFVGNDSGPKHLAALRDVPTVSIHIPRNNWSEWAQEIRGYVITRRVPCAGCGIPPDGEECGKHFTCIRGVTPEEVFAAMSDAVER